MKLVLTLKSPVQGYWDGGSKSKFEWTIDREFEDGKSRVGSWEANYYFEVKTGTTEKMTLSNAQRSLTQNLKRNGIDNFAFEYVNEDN